MSFRTVELSDPTYERDGIRFLTIKTPNLQGRGDICLFVPQVGQGTKDLPIYILLHGVYGSSWAWAFKGGAGQMAQRLMTAREIKPAIIAMPSDGLWGDGSAYSTNNERNFEMWIVHDVPLAIKENIPEAGPDSPLCIGGLSMGGYGALMLGAKHSEKFKAISGHSSITQLEQLAFFVEEPLSSYPSELSDVIDLIPLKKANLPRLRFDCGVDDSLIEANRLLHQQLENLGVPHVYEEFPGGHEWPYWQKHVEKTFRFFNESV